jgi:murein DD-endopeptidase MepM/ murein hydrolase activator NlpD
VARMGRSRPVGAALRRGTLPVVTMTRVNPIDGARIPTSGLGAWLARRSDGARLHAGVDLPMGRDTVCRAPEAGRVMQTWTASRPRDPSASSPPGWSGYGPRGVLIRGDSGQWHVLAHLDELLVTRGQWVSPGQPVGRGSVVRHCHWEVRDVARPPAGWATVELTYSPAAWLAGRLEPWAGQCPERPVDTVQTPRACRPGRRGRGGEGGGGGGGATSPRPTSASPREEEDGHGRS